MAIVYNKELLGWYVITLKLRETVVSGLRKKSTYGGSWVISINEKLERGRQDHVLGSWAKLSIYRFPHYLKNGDIKAWVPQMVSLGPYHHGEEHLRHMDRHKWRCLYRILERFNQKIGLYLDSVKKVEKRARACYEGMISMSCDEFVEMMVLYGCFVIELFQGFTEGFEKLGYPFDDPIFSMWRSILEIQRDMIMFKNQIPLFILDRLLGLQLGKPNQKGRTAQLVIQFFNPLIPKFAPIPDKRLEFDPLFDHGGVHCLEAFQRSLQFLAPKRPKTMQWSQSRKQLVRSLSKLQEAGITILCKFWSSWWDIHFHGAFLLIPQLVIHEGTRSLFLNLIAFEQSHMNCSNIVTSYVIFMHNLLNSPEDVRYLRNRGIIEHCLGSDAEVVDLFNRLCREVAFNIEDSYLYDLSKEVRMFCSGKVIYLHFSWRARLVQNWNAWRALLKNKYFDNPWSSISVVAAFILLVLTFIQALFAVYSYYWPRS